jgi:hypothetical protein
MTHSRSGRERRDCFDRRSGSDRRRGGDQRKDWYKAVARRLPEEVISQAGDPRKATIRLVSRYFSHVPEPARADLAQVLIPVLQDIKASGSSDISDKQRDQCEALVESWVRRQTDLAG